MKHLQVVHKKIRAQENFTKKEPGSVTTPRPSLYSLSTSQPMLAHLQARQLKATQRQVA